MSVKQIIRSVAFMLVVFAVFVLLSDLFENSTAKNFDKRLYTYRELDEDIVDAVFIGTSGVDRYWNSCLGFDQFGIAMYSLSTDAMPGWLYPIMIEEALAYQNPQLFLLDIRGYLQDGEDATKMDVRGRRVIDAMDFFSVNRIKACLKTREIVRPLDKSGYQETGISYIFPFIKYHTMWADEDYRIDDHLGNKPHQYGSFYVSSLTVKTEKQVPAEYDSEYFADLDPVYEKELYILIDYVKKHNLETLFVITPKVFKEKEMGRMNSMLKILEENDMPYAMFTAEDNPENELAVNLNWDEDFYDAEHVNYKGANKFTDVLGRYLQDHYDLPDRRKDERASVYWGPLNDKLITEVQRRENSK